MTGSPTVKAPAAIGESVRFKDTHGWKTGRVLARAALPKAALERELRQRQAGVSHFMLILESRGEPGRGLTLAMWSSRFPDLYVPIETYLAHKPLVAFRLLQRAHPVVTALERRGAWDLGEVAKGLEYKPQLKVIAGGRA